MHEEGGGHSCAWIALASRIKLTRPPFSGAVFLSPTEIPHVEPACLDQVCEIRGFRERPEPHQLKERKQKMLKAALFGAVLSTAAISAAWALPSNPATGLTETAASNLIEVGRRDGWRRGHWRHRNWRHHRGHWRGWHHGGRYWRHRYYYRPRHWWGCINVGPVWYCD